MSACLQTQSLLTPLMRVEIGNSDHLLDHTRSVVAGGLIVYEAGIKQRRVKLKVKPLPSKRSPRRNGKLDEHLFIYQPQGR